MLLAQENNLMESAVDGNLLSVKKLLEVKADINGTDPEVHMFDYTKSFSLRHLADTALCSR
jgi:hypothetical protein